MKQLNEIIFKIANAILTNQKILYKDFEITNVEISKWHYPFTCEDDYEITIHYIDPNYKNAYIDTIKFDINCVVEDINMYNCEFAISFENKEHINQLKEMIENIILRNSED